MDQNNGFDREEERKEENESPAYRVINGAGNAPFEFEENTKKEKRSGIHAAVIVLLCVLCVLGGAFAALGILNARTQKTGGLSSDTRESEYTEETVFAPESKKAETGALIGTETGERERTSEPEDPLQRIVIGDGSGNALSPKQIYSENVRSVVGIVAEGTTRNIFGQTSKTASSGTGFLLTEDGYIMTNNHVIESGSALTVTLYDGRSFKAAVIGADEDNDVAVLKIDADGLRPVTLGDSERIAVGDGVCVIGNPLGELTFTMTRGIVSALNRTIHADSTPIRMFQIDAAVNAGNSGGPAFSETGEVIGIVTAKYASDSIEGIGFCIPIRDARHVAEDLIRYGYVRGKTTIGVEVIDAIEAYEYYYRYYGRWGQKDILSNLSRTGAFVNSVKSGSAADKAGIEAGDTILAWDGRELNDASDFENELKACIPGQTAVLTVLEDGIATKVTVTVDELIPAGITPSAGAEKISF